MAGLGVVEGNTEDLPFADQSFDAVLNVEAPPPQTRLGYFGLLHTTCTESSRVLGTERGRHGNGHN